MAEEAAANDRKQDCLDLVNAAMRLFDMIEADGVTSPTETVENILVLKEIVDKAEKLRSYYFRRNLHRMIALGISPETLLKQATGG